MLLDRFEESRVLCEQAIDIAVRLDARQAESHARNTLGLDLVAQGRVAEGIESMEHALGMAFDQANVDDIGRGYVNLVSGLLVRGLPGTRRRDRRSRHARRRRVRDHEHLRDVHRAQRASMIDDRARPVGPRGRAGAGVGHHPGYAAREPLRPGPLDPAPGRSAATSSSPTRSSSGCTSCSTERPVEGQFHGAYHAARDRARALAGPPRRRAADRDRRPRRPRAADLDVVPAPDPPAGGLGRGRHRRDRSRPPRHRRRGAGG